MSAKCQEQKLQPEQRLKLNSGGGTSIHPKQKPLANETQIPTTSLSFQRILLLLLSALAASAQRRQQFADYDYELAPAPAREAQRTAAGRGRAVPNPGRTTEKPETTTAVAILKQINE